MKSKQASEANGAKSKWPRTGVFESEPHALTPEQRDDILLAVAAQGHRNRHKFIEAVEVALGSYSASREFEKLTTPAEVRRRIHGLLEQVSQLKEQIVGLDRHSEWLLHIAGRGPGRYVPSTKEIGKYLYVGATPQGEHIKEYRPGFTFDEGFAAICDLKVLAEKVLNQTKDHPRGRIEDWSKKNLAKDVALALRAQLGTEPTNGQDEAFSIVLRLALDCAGARVRRGTDGSARDVRELVRFALKELSEAQ